MAQWGSLLAVAMLIAVVALYTSPNLLFPKIYMVQPPASDPIFHRFPFTSRRAIGKQRTPVDLPFHCYDVNDVVILHGTSDANVVAKLLQEQNGLYPVLDPSGRALTHVWLVDYNSTGVGPYLENIVLFLVSYSPLHLTAADCPVTSLCGAWAIVSHPNVFGYSHRLYLSEQLPIDYGREIFGTDKYLANITFHRTRERTNGATILRAMYNNISNHQPLVEATVALVDDAWNQAAFIPLLARQFGVLQLFNIWLASEAPQGLISTLLAPANIATPHEHFAGINPQSMQASRANYRLREFATGAGAGIDAIVFHEESLARLNFTASLVQWSEDMRFVYLPPHNAGIPRV